MDKIKYLKYLDEAISTFDSLHTHIKPDSIEKIKISGALLALKEVRDRINSGMFDVAN